MAPIKSIEYFRVPPRWLFVKITDENGNYGWGEATLESHTQAVEGCLEFYKSEIENIWQTAWRKHFYCGGAVFMSALSGIDTALWDMKGRKLGVPIYELLGGKVRDKIKVYAWIVRHLDQKADDEERQQRLDAGFTCVKMNATADLGWLDSPAALQTSVDRLETVKKMGLDVGAD
ncbi:galactonate dehydratase [Colletotrichum salicis]|uniref:Galactonate dehydratase n=1 Tax=Colletotrichum salicis TaxID=1209931 RepID=A0A135UVG5_9PEZI|nr:galactonate dehydratase [Colletotrichum salicis]